jgi:ABC-type branched-subunit amino acid transport system substrate-binding protein
MRNTFMHLGKIVIGFLFITFSFRSVAQSQPAKTIKVAVLLPLYLDSGFNGSTYKLGNNNLPKYMLPGLEFYHGVMMAIDSLQQEGQHLEVMIHDIKSRDKSLSLLLVEPEIANASFIIGSFTTKEELNKVSDFAAAKKIPLISATYPNDGGVTGNPFLAIINPTLPTHVEAVFKYVQRNYSLDNVVLVKRKGDAMDKYITDMIMDVAKKYSGLALKMKYIEVSDLFNAQEIISHLDSTRKNIIIGATLNETFAGNIVRTLSSVKTTYESTAVGMPTWDNMNQLNRPDTRGVEIVYSTPYGYQKGDKLLGRLAASYKSKLNGRATDMVFKGYEAMYHFTRLYLKHDSSFLNSLSDKDFRIVNEYDIQPTKARKEDPSTDYLENKKLYFVKKLDGVIKTIN